jgi:uncharacterized protein
MDKNSNSLNWFEIPATDIARAVAYYQTVFAIEIPAPMEMKEMTMAMLPADDGKVGGALVKSQYHTPSTAGAWVYLNCNPSLQAVVDRVAGAGGTVTIPPMEISPEIGYMAAMIDSEGNQVALHAGKL